LAIGKVKPAAEKNDPNKWWYRDLSDDKNLEKLRLEF
jgi:hypothetical protein